MLAAGFCDDVGPVDVAAFAYRSGDDDVPQVFPTDQLRSAAGRKHLAGIRAGGDSGVFEIPNRLLMRWGLLLYCLQDSAHVECSPDRWLFQFLDSLGAVEVADCE